MMRQFFFFFLTAISVAMLCGCKHEPGVCYIQGVMGSDQYEGKRIFLVPLNGPATAETVDSIEIKDRKFEFTTDTMQMYKIILDYHYRMGIQPLLVVGEPGVVKVTIDSISHAGGTPQNDSLEQWKILTEEHNHQMANFRRMMTILFPQGLPKDKEEMKRRSDNVTKMVENMKMRSDSIHLAYKKRTRQMAANLKEGPLHDFLADLYPTTYRKKLPDGRIVTMNADTNEEIPE